MAQSLSRRPPINKPILPAHRNAKLVAYMENKDLVYCQYLFITTDGDFVLAKVGAKDSKPMLSDLTPKEAKQVYDDVNYRLIAWGW